MTRGERSGQAPRISVFLKRFVSAWIEVAVVKEKPEHLALQASRLDTRREAKEASLGTGMPEVRQTHPHRDRDRREAR
jgi:hypothetical protein